MTEVQNRKYREALAANGHESPDGFPYIPVRPHQHYACKIIFSRRS